MPKRFTAKKVGDQYVIVPQGEQEQMNRTALAAGGALVALLGLKRGGLLGLLATMGGGCMLFRGITGYSPLARLLCDRPGGDKGESTESPSFQHSWKPSQQVASDDVDEAAMESFPASDPPAHTPTASA
ncbi:MAG TPA: hypothetical protein VF669_01265 [Tepidisphaeraceae bacterium]|jgi:hypothetical protein